MHPLISNPQNRTGMDSGRVLSALVALLTLVQFVVAQTPTTKPPPAKPVPTRTEPVGTTNIGPMLEIANRPDFPMYVAGNSGQIVMVGDMQGSGWSDYLPLRATSITTDRTGTLYLADTTSLVIRDNRLGGKQQTIDMRLRLLDIKFDSRDRLLGISSDENCVVRV